MSGDSWLSSFAFFIIPAVSYFLTFNKKWQSFKSIVFIFLAFLMLIAFKYPGINNHLYSIQSGLSNGGIQDTIYSSLPLKNRIVDRNNYVSEQTAELNEFFNDNMSPEATFYDYSNSPMLYHYLSKRVPSYFNQPLLSIHDEYLQKTLIEQLKSDDIPYIVYSNFPDNWYDIQDGVPKNLRHFYLGEYFHQEYRPFALIGKYSIWIKKDQSNSVLLSAIDYQLDTIDDDQKILFDTKRILEKRIWLVLYEFNTDHVYFNDNRIMRSYFDGVNSYFHIEKDGNEKNALIIDGNPDFTLASCDFFPDNYSLRNRTYNLKYLPRIWAQNESLENYNWQSLELHDNNNENVSAYIIEDSNKDYGAAFVMINARINWGEFSEIQVVLKDDKNQIKGTFKFIITKNDSENNYLIRMSSQMAWYFSDIHYIEVVTDGKSSIDNLSIASDSSSKPLLN